MDVTTHSRTADRARTREDWRPRHRVLSVRLWGVLALISNVLIILTGGLVRLTGSGLGCPTWPRCTDDSYLPHPELGMHGVIEFGNRLLTFVLAIVVIGLAAAAFSCRDADHPRGRLRRLLILLAIGIPVLAVAMVVMIASDYHLLGVLAACLTYLIIVAVSLWLTRGATASGSAAARNSLLQRLGLLIALGVPGQAVVGGVTVLTDLNPYLVAIHLLISFALVAASTWFLHTAWGDPRRCTTPLGHKVARLTVIVLVVVLWLGTVVTGSGPHSGDEFAPRTGLDPAVMSHVHAAAVYLAVALTLATWWLTRARAALILLTVELTQGGIGFVQYFTGLPVAVVAAHLVGSALVVVAATHLLWNTSAPNGYRRP